MKIKATIKEIKDQSGIKRIKSQLVRLNKALETYKGRTLGITGQSVKTAREFIKIMSERERLGFQLDELETSKDCFHIKLSAIDPETQFLPAGFEDFKIQSEGYRQDSFRILPKNKESTTVRLFLYAHRAPNWDIYIRSIHAEAPFCIILSKTGIYFMQPTEE